MKIIFLDIDGVVCINNSWCYQSVKTLNEILKSTGAKIVVSSDWRYQHTLEDLKNIFKHQEIECEVVGVTPIKRTVELDYLEKIRASEIIEFINLNKITQYLIIDDLSLENTNVNKEKFVKTQFSIGLKEFGLFERCLQILENKII
jgi:hypothetical protein